MMIGTSSDNDLPPDAPSQKRRPSARELAEDRIRKGIVAGEFLPGEHLSERELGALTGVSRAVAREAIRGLVSEGLLTVVRFRGPIVTQLTLKEAQDLYEMRALLEGSVAKLFVQRAGDDQVQALLDSIEEIGRGHAKSDMVAVISSSQRFYEVLAAGAENDAMAQTLANLHNRMALFRFSSTRWPGRAERSMAELRSIGAAILARDAEGAEEAARVHIQRAGEMALLVIAERNRAVESLHLKRRSRS